MKKLFVIALVVIGLMLISSLGANASDKPIVITYASGYGDNFSLSMHDKWWAKELEKRTAGKVKVEFYWSEALVKIPEALDAVKTGIADISFFATGYFGGQLPLSTSAQLFYITEKPDAMSLAMMDVYNAIPAFRDEYEKKNNAKVLTFSGCTPNIVGIRKPWKGLDDFKGKKIRVFPGWEEPVSALGGTPVTISWGEIYTSLEHGVVDAYTGTMWDLAGIGKFHEQAPYLLDLKQGSCAMAATVMNIDSWNKLPPDVKKVLQDVTQESMRKQAELYMEADARIYEVYKKANVKTLAFSAGDVEKFKSLIVPKRWDKWKADMQAKGLPGKEFHEKLVVSIKNYEPESKYISPFVKYPDLAFK